MYNYIDDTIKIDFPVSKDIKWLMKKCEEADKDNNYGAYNSFAEALVYGNAKEAYANGNITMKQWQQLEMRYEL